MRRLRKLTFAFALLVSGWFSATPATASPVTVKFAGQWNFIDIEWKTMGCSALPEQCAFVAAMASIGVTSGTPVFFSLTFDHALDSNPDPMLGNYTDGVTGVLTLGQVRYQLNSPAVIVSAPSPCGGGTCPGSLTIFGGMSGQNINNSGGIYTPPSFTASFNGPGISSDHLSTIDWSALTSLYPALDTSILFHSNFGSDKGRFSLNVVSVTVPEPNTLVTLSGALLGFVAWTQRARYKG